jgi:hypothetical protein
VINSSNRELMIDELDIVNGGRNEYCCAGPENPNEHGNGSGNGLGWLRGIGSAVGGVIKTIGGIIGL